ncbi:hypothetical protein GWK47_032356 [Chionoecetes opilio]|uniref:Uncharacterized protein n=1 Tax=Chionoecetes opilio TaxID=41210 RepID=A0A8J4YJ38_CHIOP|nr:hypothetical protein GWK47_032356 [Chionoecetes opilio]
MLTSTTSAGIQGAAFSGAPPKLLSPLGWQDAKGSPGEGIRTTRDRVVVQDPQFPKGSTGGTSDRQLNRGKVRRGSMGLLRDGGLLEFTPPVFDTTASKSGVLGGCQVLEQQLAGRVLPGPQTPLFRSAGFGFFWENRLARSKPRESLVQALRAWTIYQDNPTTLPQTKKG